MWLPLARRASPRPDWTMSEEIDEASALTVPLPGAHGLLGSPCNRAAEALSANGCSRRTPVEGPVPNHEVSNVTASN